MLFGLCSPPPHPFSRLFFPAYDFETSFETIPLPVTVLKTHTLRVTHTKKNWSEREGGFLQTDFLKEKYQMKDSFATDNDNVSARPSVTLNKNHIRKWRKGQRSRLSSKERRKRGGKGCVRRF